MRVILPSRTAYNIDLKEEVVTFEMQELHKVIEVNIQQLAEELSAKLKRLQPEQRVIIGLVGYPGAGKSTVSAALVNAVNNLHNQTVASVVPMDGYHFSNEELESKGLLALKGVPDTFDASSFIVLLKELRKPAVKTVCCPKFDRSIEASIPDGIAIEPEHRLLVVEGNYLLLDKEPWNSIRDLLDEAWFLHADLNTILPRLVERHREGGRTESGIKTKMESTDIPNAHLIDKTKAFAHRVLDVRLD